MSEEQQPAATNQLETTEEDQSPPDEIVEIDTVPTEAKDDDAERDEESTLHWKSRDILDWSRGRPRFRPSESERRLSLPLPRGCSPKEGGVRRLSMERKRRVPKIDLESPFSSVSAGPLALPRSRGGSAASSRSSSPGANSPRTIIGYEHLNDVTWAHRIRRRDSWHQFLSAAKDEDPPQQHSNRCLVGILESTEQPSDSAALDGSDRHPSESNDTCTDGPRSGSGRSSPSRLDVTSTTASVDSKMSGSVLRTASRGSVAAVPIRDALFGTPVRRPETPKMTAADDFEWGVRIKRRDSLSKLQEEAIRDYLDTVLMGVPDHGEAEADSDSALEPDLPPAGPASTAAGAGPDSALPTHTSLPRASESRPLASAPDASPSASEPQRPNWSQLLQADLAALQATSAKILS